MGLVKRQGLKNTISSYIGILIGFVSLIIIQPKFLSPEIIGLSRVLFAFSSLLGSFLPLGGGNITIKYFPKFFNPKENHHGFFGFVLLFPIVGSLITFIVLLLFKDAIIAKYSAQSPLFASYFYLVFPFCVFLGLTTLFNSYLSSIYKSTIPAYFSDIVVRLLYIILILLFYFQVIDIRNFVVGYVCIYSLQVLALLLYIKIEGHPSFKIDWNKFKRENFSEMIQFGLVVSVAGFASMGLLTIDAVILAKYGLQNLGIYTVVSFIPTVIQTPLMALDRISASKIAFELHENNTKELQAIYYKSCKYLFIIGCFLAVVINTNIADLLSFIKPEYLVALPIVPIVSIGYLFNMAGGTNTSILLYSGGKWESALLIIVAFVLTFILDIVLIPKIGMLGAAYSIAITAMLFTLLKFYLMKKRFGFQPYNLSFILIILITALSWGVCALIPNFTYPLILMMLKGGITTLIFLGGIYFFKIIPLDWKKL